MKNNFNLEDLKIVNVKRVGPPRDHEGKHILKTTFGREYNIYPYDSEKIRIVTLIEKLSQKDREHKEKLQLEREKFQLEREKFEWEKKKL